MPGTDVPPSHVVGSLQRVVSTYVATPERAHARVLINALEREGFTINAHWGPLDEIAGRAPAHLDLLVVIEPDRDAYDRSKYAALRHALAHTAIVVICSAGRTQPQELMWAGVDGIVFEPGADAVIGPTVRGVLAGYVVVPHTLRAAIQPPPLTARERQMLELVSEGLTNREIADRLFLGESTVKRHLSSAFRRLGVSSRREAAAALLGGQISPDAPPREPPNAR
jgi:DNA-binding NarL/FixJ family response regulator